MSMVELAPELWQAAAVEAERRGLSVDAVVAEAVRRFVAGADLRRLLSDLDEVDAARPDTPTEAEAMQIACEEIAATRTQRLA